MIYNRIIAIDMNRLDELMKFADGKVNVRPKYKGLDNEYDVWTSDRRHYKTVDKIVEEFDIEG